jgi:hypothetical protein
MVGSLGLVEAAASEPRNGGAALRSTVFAFQFIIAAPPLLKMNSSLLISAHCSQAAHLGSVI